MSITICGDCMSTDVVQGTHLDDSGKVTQIESVVGLGRCGQQLGNGLAVHLQSGSNDAWAQLLAALGKPSTAEVPCQNGLEDCHQCLICHLCSNNITYASNSMSCLCTALRAMGASKRQTTVLDRHLSHSHHTHQTPVSHTYASHFWN